MGGVSQATVSKWERGDWEPTRAMALRLRDVMLGLHEGRLADEIACLQPQQTLRALARGAGLQIVGVSDGFRRAWPPTSDLIGAETRRHLINEAAHYYDESDYLREAADGELLTVADGLSVEDVAGLLYLDEASVAGWKAMFSKRKPKAA